MKIGSLLTLLSLGDKNMSIGPFHENGELQLLNLNFLNSYSRQCDKSWIISKEKKKQGWLLNQFVSPKDLKVILT